MAYRDSSCKTSRATTRCTICTVTTKWQLKEICNVYPLLCRSTMRIMKWDLCCRTILEVRGGFVQAPQMLRRLWNMTEKKKHKILKIGSLARSHSGLRQLSRKANTITNPTSLVKLAASCPQFIVSTVLWECRQHMPHPHALWHLRHIFCKTIWTISEPLHNCEWTRNLWFFLNDLIPRAMMLTAPAAHTLWEVSWHILEGAILLWGPARFALSRRSRAAWCCLHEPAFQIAIDWMQNPQGFPSIPRISGTLLFAVFRICPSSDWIQSAPQVLWGVERRSSVRKSAGRVHFLGQPLEGNMGMSQMDFSLGRISMRLST